MPLELPVKLLPDIVPVAATLVGVMFPNDNVICAEAPPVTVPEIPFADTTVIVVILVGILAQTIFVPVVWRYFPVFEDCDGNSAFIAAVAVVWPVPPLAIATMPDTLFAVVAVVAVVELEALPVNAPINVEAETDDKPPNVDIDPPNDTFDEPIVIELLVKALFGIFVKFVPIKMGVFDQLGIPDVTVRT